MPILAIVGVWEYRSKQSAMTHSRRDGPVPPLKRADAGPQSENALSRTERPARGVTAVVAGGCYVFLLRNATWGRWQVAPLV
jgi:hypothetical protein